MKEEREVITWTNSWISNANTETNRFLLVGDSTTRQIRGSMEALLRETYSVDLIAASFSVCDNKLFEYIKAFFKGNEYKYDVIILQYGGHHGFSRMCVEDEKYHYLYAKKYERLVKYLKSKCKNVFIVTSTSETIEGNVETIDLYRDKEIRERNKIIEKVGQKNKCNIFDLYTLVKNNSDTYKYYDRQHLTRDSDDFISYQILLSVIEKTENMKLQSRNVIHKNQRKLSCILGETKGIFIYGGGVKGRELFWILKWNMLDKLIKGFVVSNKDQEGKLYGIPILCIDEIPESLRKESPIIISSKKYEKEMKYRAAEQGFQHIRFMDEVKECLT